VTPDLLLEVLGQGRTGDARADSGKQRRRGIGRSCGLLRRLLDALGKGAATDVLPVPPAGDAEARRDGQARAQHPREVRRLGADPARVAVFDLGE
jgi:hypothetical protein